ncbi:hypothetical protein [Runella sp. SP2]|uniref:hypothetical protein n=1 Tax=Runella sp. SP2 TaxID=2268026 RepID=UPI000F095EFA|nr:hypothetical protein [Runella sp. SP2]AYQ31359.1 hypothetical protein DTQ70_03840 [Runella sp. SP2]
MKIKHLANLMKSADGGFIVITLKQADTNNIGSIFGSSNLDFDTVTSILEEIVQERKARIRSQQALKLLESYDTIQPIAGYLEPRMLNKP